MEIELRMHIIFISLYFIIIFSLDTLPVIPINWESKIDQTEINTINSLLLKLGYNRISKNGLLTIKGQNQLFNLGSQLKSIYIDTLGLVSPSWNSSLTRFHSSPYS